LATVSRPVVWVRMQR